MVGPQFLAPGEGRRLSVREDDGFTLIDTGLGCGAKKIVATAREAGAPIVRIALTHAHADYAGGLDAVEHVLGDEGNVYLGDLDARSPRASR